MGNIIKRWLERLENANKENFGSQPLDCCTVGRDKKTTKPMNVSTKKPSK